MTKPQINPYLVTPGYRRFHDYQAPGGRIYLSVVGGRGWQIYANKKFRTATRALAHANKLITRWRRKYAALDPKPRDFGIDVMPPRLMEKFMEHASSVARTEEVGESSQLIAPIEQENSHERQAEGVAEQGQGSAGP
jgi:hypothetical protein